MPRKQIKPEDVKVEDIDRVIDNTLYGIEETKSKGFQKLFTFILMFIFYIYFSIKIEAYFIKLIVIIFGIVLLVFLFQDIVLPSLMEKKKKRVLEP